MIENQVIPIASMLILLGVALYYGRRAGWPARPGAGVTVDSHRYWFCLGALLVIALIKLTVWVFGSGLEVTAPKTTTFSASTDTAHRGSSK